MEEENMSVLDYSNDTYYCPNGDCSFAMGDIYEKLIQDDLNNILIITILLAILSCVGTLGNLCVLIVFSQRFPKSTSTLFILVLGAIDLLICSFVIPGVIAKTWYLSFYWDWFCKAWEMFQMYSLPTSALLLAAIAFDRYFLICMATNSLMTIKRAKIVIGVIIVSGLAFSIPPLLAMGVYEIDDDGFKVYRGICIENFELITIQGLNKYWVFVMSIFLVVIITVAVLYTKVFLTVYKQGKKWRKNCANKIHPCQRRVQPLGHWNTGPVDGTSGPSVPTTILEAGAQLTTSNGASNCCQRLCCCKKTQDTQNEVFIIQVNPLPNQQELNQDTENLPSLTNNISQSCKQGNSTSGTSTREKGNTETGVIMDTISSETDIIPSSSAKFHTDYTIQKHLSTDDLEEREIIQNPGTLTGKENMSRGIDQYKTSIVPGNGTVTNSILRTNATKLSNHEEAAHKVAAISGAVIKTDSKPDRNIGLSCTPEHHHHTNEGATIPGMVMETDSRLNNRMDSVLPHTRGRMAKTPKTTTVIEMGRGKNYERPHRAHVKTAQVVFMVTLVYIVSFLPTFLVTFQLINNEAIFYIYFLNNAANPIIYSFMNRKFRTEVKAMVKNLLNKIGCIQRN